MKQIFSLLLLVHAGAGVAPSASLYDQSIAEVLRKQFTSPPLSYILMDVPAGTIVAAHWEDSNRAVPAGSLVKPFTALAYAQSHGYRYPGLTCRGAIDGCWLPRGHGRIGMREAIGYSCNAYFRKLARQISHEDIEPIAIHYGIRGFHASFSAPDLVGLGDKLEMRPEQIARAYLELVGHSTAPGVEEILQGMALSARAGTAGAIQKSMPGGAALAKTGTAPCLHSRHAPGDGYTVVLYPAESPRWALLVRVHGAPGALAAEVAGTMLRTIVKGQ